MVYCYGEQNGTAWVEKDGRLRDVAWGRGRENSGVFSGEMMKSREMMEGVWGGVK